MASLPGDLETQPLYAKEGAEGAKWGLLPEGDMLLPSGWKQAPFLDITRICCVVCVAIDHGYRSFGQWNSLFTQDWVLQFLYLVCGVCFGMSRRSLLSYEARLGCYLSIGISVNLLAWIATGKDWKNNMFNVIFHFWFIAGLMLYAALLAPLRPYLARVRERAAAPAPETEAPHAEGGRRSFVQDGTLRAGVMVIVGIGAIMLGFRWALQPLFVILGPTTWRFWRSLGDGADFWGLPDSPFESQEFLVELSTYCMLTCCNLYLIWICPKVFHHISFTSWAVFINTYLHRMFFYRAADERPFHGLDLMMLGLTVYYLGIRYRRTIGEYLARYWFLVIFVCGLAWQPGYFGRLDENPPADIRMRVRMNFVEGVFTFCWLAAAERIARPEIFTVDRLDFLNDWALLVFVAHKAAHIVLPAPFNWIFLIALAPCCCIARRHM